MSEHEGLEQRATLENKIAAINDIYDLLCVHSVYKTGCGGCAVSRLIQRAAADRTAKLTARLEALARETKSLKEQLAEAVELLRWSVPVFGAADNDVLGWNRTGEDSGYPIIRELESKVAEFLKQYPIAKKEVTG